MGRLSSEATRIRGHKGVALRKRRMARSKWLCEHCLAKGVTRVATIVNHKVPLAHGGEDVDENTENLCAECDDAETARVFNRKRPVAIGIDGWPA